MKMYLGQEGYTTVTEVTSTTTFQFHAPLSGGAVFQLEGSFQYFLITF